MPAFSVSYMDRQSARRRIFMGSPRANGLRTTPFRPTRRGGGASSQLAERNIYLIHALLEDAAAAQAPEGTPRREAGDFYAAAMDTNRIEELRFKPICRDLKRIDRQSNQTTTCSVCWRVFTTREWAESLCRRVARMTSKVPFTRWSWTRAACRCPTAITISRTNFASQRQAYREHVAKMFALLGEKPAAPTPTPASCWTWKRHWPRPAARGSICATPTRITTNSPRPNSWKIIRAIAVAVYLSERALEGVPYAIVGQPGVF